MIARLRVDCAVIFVAAVARAISDLLASAGRRPSHRPAQGRHRPRRQDARGPAPQGRRPGAERRAAVRKIADEIFDFNEIARRVARPPLAGPLTDKQRAEFVGAVQRPPRALVHLQDRAVRRREDPVRQRARGRGDRDAWCTRIVTKNGTEVPIDYRLLRKGDRWLVYDVNIEGVSLVSNYRTQFNKIIQTSSYDDLIQKLKAKQGERRAGGRQGRSRQGQDAVARPRSGREESP